MSNCILALVNDYLEHGIKSVQGFLFFFFEKKHYEEDEIRGSRERKLMYT